MSDTDDAKKQVEEARKRLKGTVEEIGTAIDDTKADVERKAKKAAPFAAAAAGALVLLKVLRRGSRRKKQAG